MFERGPDALRVAGRIWHIDQTLHAFWLEIAQHRGQDVFAWFLYFDVIESTERRARNALDNHDSPGEITWRATLAGEARVHENTLAIVSARVIGGKEPV